MDFHRFEDLNRGMATPRDVIVPGLPALLLHGDGLNSGAPLHEGMGSGVDSKVHKTEQEKELARQKMFDYIDLKSTGASVRGEECLESTVGRPRRFTESRVVGMSFEKAARGEECNEYTMGGVTPGTSVSRSRGGTTPCTPRGTTCKPWSSLPSGGLTRWGMHSTQMIAEEEKIMENHMEDHTTEIEGECYCQETIAMSASTDILQKHRNENIFLHNYDEVANLKSCLKIFYTFTTKKIQYRFW